jgi:hypothetical protein
VRERAALLDHFDADAVGVGEDRLERAGARRRQLGDQRRGAVDARLVGEGVGEQPGGLSLPVPGAAAQQQPPTGYPVDVEVGVALLGRCRLLGAEPAGRCGGPLRVTAERLQLDLDVVPRAVRSAGRGAGRQ